MKQQKKPLKTSGDFYRDANMKVIKFSRRQAIGLIKKFKKEKEARYTNGFKYKHLELIEKDEYFCYSLS